MIDCFEYGCVDVEVEVQCENYVCSEVWGCVEDLEGLMEVVCEVD